MLTVKIVPVHGTWAWDGDEATAGEWWLPDSAWTRFMAEQGVTLAKPDDPFHWSADADGTLLEMVLGRNRHADWEAGGHALAWYLAHIPYGERNIIAHSHGGQVAAYAALRVQMRRLVTVATPSRKDMVPVYTQAVQNIGQWTHVHTDWSDKMQILGSLFDGRWGVHRGIKQADVNIKIPKVGHSKILNDPALFNQWVEAGLVDTLKLAVADRRHL